MTRELRYLRRLIVAAAVLILLGMMPTLLAVGALHLPKVSESWLGRVSLAPMLEHVALVWAAILPQLHLFRYVGIALLAAGVIYILWKRWWVDAFAKSGVESPLTTHEVLVAEAEDIDGAKPDDLARGEIDIFTKRVAAEADAEERRLIEAGEAVNEDAGFDVRNQVSPGLYRWLRRQNRAALCLSGGGIRSASFGLGVLQALASHPGRSRAGSFALQNSDPEQEAQRSVLGRIHYLSTVSGGGYIGSWLSAWLHRDGFVRVWSDLTRRPSDLRNPGDEPNAVQWIRDHSNYLTPQLGLTSADTLAGISIVMRNTILNWFIILPTLIAALCLFKLFELLVLILSTHDQAGTTPLHLFGWLAAIGFAAMIVALRFRLRNRTSVMNLDEKMWRHQPDGARVFKYGILPLLVAAAALTLCLALASVQLEQGAYTGWVSRLFEGVMEGGRFKWPDILGIGAICGTLLYAVSWLSSGPRVWSKGLGEFWRWTISGTVYGTLVAATIYFISGTDFIEWSFYTPLEWIQRLFGELPRNELALNRRALALVFLVVPMLLLAQLVSEMVFVGLQSDEKDDDREWLGRVAGLVLRAAVFWIVIIFLACVSSDVALRIISSPVNWVTMGLIYIGGTWAAMFGRDAHTPAQSQGSGVASGPKSAFFTTLAIMFAVSLIVVVSAGIDWVVLGRSISEVDPRDPKQQWQAFGLILKAFAVSLAIGAIASKTINVNRFSMHALYRNRLVRTFLGASVPEDKRRPDRFTQFSASDNLRMHCLREQYQHKKPLAGKTGDDWRPFHIVNIALNVTASDKRLSWQERKAASFTVSPLHCGSSYTGYRSSKSYGAKEGISLGTAMAISGAAASPNQGYNSSPALAFLMALFNVRLGWWLGNPGPAGESTYAHDGPRTAVKSLLSEMLGMTRDDGEYVYLSDGGHFENLGLYEMVRRRCRLIIVSDAGCDPHYAFEDLGNAVRKIQIDLGVRIRFWGLDKLRPRGADGAASGIGPYHAIGEINYVASDGRSGNDDRLQNGIILYIKPAYHGTESSAGIRSYAAVNRDFPHDDTANQWFGESQLESYRALGFEITDAILTEGFAVAARTSGKPVDELDLEDVLMALRQNARESPADIPTRVA